MCNDDDAAFVAVDDDEHDNPTASFALRLLKDKEPNPAPYKTSEIASRPQNLGRKSMRRRGGGCVERWVEEGVLRLRLWCGVSVTLTPSFEK